MDVFITILIAQSLSLKKMKCNCASLNRPESTGSKPPVALDPNKFFKWDTPGKVVYVDACISDEVRVLWEAGIWTKGSCCGHNGMFERSIILDEGADEKTARRLIAKRTNLLMWKLMHV